MLYYNFSFLGYGIFYIDGIFPLESIGKINYQSGIMMAEAMKFAVERVNNNSKSLFGYTLEFKTIHNSSNDSLIPGTVLDMFLKNTSFIIGPYSSETSYVTSILRKTFLQIAISYSAVYSDFDTTAMFRTIPSNAYRVQALLDLVVRLE